MKPEMPIDIETPINSDLSLQCWSLGNGSLEAWGKIEVISLQNDIPDRHIQIFTYLPITKSKMAKNMTFVYFLSVNLEY